MAVKREATQPVRPSPNLPPLPPCRTVPSAPRFGEPRCHGRLRVDTLDAPLVATRPDLGRKRFGDERYTVEELVGELAPRFSVPISASRRKFARITPATSTTG